MDVTTNSTTTPRRSSQNSKTASGKRSQSATSSPLSAANTRLLHTLLTLATQYSDDSALLQSAINSLTSSLSRLNHINTISLTLFSSPSWSSSAADNSRLYERITDDCHRAHTVTTNTIAALVRAYTTILDTHSRLNTQLMQLAAPQTRIAATSSSTSSSMPTAALSIVELYMLCYDLIQLIMRVHSNRFPSLQSLLSAALDDAQPLSLQALTSAFNHCSADNEQCRSIITSIQTTSKIIAE